MTRVSADPVQDYAVMGAAELVETLGSPEENGLSRCVVMRTKERALPEALAAAGIEFTREEAGRYAVLAFAPPLVSPSFATQLGVATTRF